MYKMNQKQINRFQRSFAFLKIFNRPPPPTSLPLRIPIKHIIMPSAVALAALVFYDAIQHQNPNDHYELTPLEHQKIMSTSV